MPQLLTAREETLPHGTLHLAMLYAAHGGALCRLLKEGRVPPPKQSDVKLQALRALEAAARIRETCLGAEHPLSCATKAACERITRR